MNWLTYARKQDHTANVAMWQLCRAAYRYLNNEDGSAAQFAASLTPPINEDSVYRYENAYGLFVALCRINRRLSATYRRKLRYSHFATLARAVRSYNLSSAQIFNEFDNALGDGQPLTVRDLAANIEAEHGRHNVRDWQERRKAIVSYFQDLLAVTDAPQGFKDELLGLLERWFY